MKLNIEIGLIYFVMLLCCSVSKRERNLERKHAERKKTTGRVQEEREKTQVSKGM